jgi:hypothetical protein
MRTIVSLITAAAFALHFTLGCCAHHAHAAEGTVCSGHANLADHHHDSHDHDGRDHDGRDHESPGPCDQSPADSDSECPSQHCNDGHCVFMAAGKTVVAKDTFTAALPLCIAEPASVESISPLAAAAIDFGGRIALPVRTHLFNQVLLI